VAVVDGPFVVYLGERAYRVEVKAGETAEAVCERMNAILPPPHRAVPSDFGGIADGDEGGA